MHSLVSVSPVITLPSNFKISHGFRLLKIRFLTIFNKDYQEYERLCNTKKLTVVKRKILIRLPFSQIFNQGNYFIAYLFELISRDGIVLTTVDHSDIRGLCTALHGFVVELPRSNFGSWANGRIQKCLRGFSLTVIASLIMSWK